MHGDIKRGDWMFYFTICGRMMWNWLVSGMASGATSLLYDGSPFRETRKDPPDLCRCRRHDALLTGKSIDAIAKAGLAPTESDRLDRLCDVLDRQPCGGKFRRVYARVKAICNSHRFPGTDIPSRFVGGNPIGPAYRGEIQCAGLGMARTSSIQRAIPSGAEKGGTGTRPFPVMPPKFWNDQDNAKYRRPPTAFRRRGVMAILPSGRRMTASGHLWAIRRHVESRGVRIGTADLSPGGKLPECWRVL
ncbi:MAG: hypothetical protein IPP18_12010 [Rhodocyclaceae bacterium]|nr:hypothetical protein [Rhodocyclaceae bacterium]